MSPEVLENIVKSVSALSAEDRQQLADAIRAGSDSSHNSQTSSVRLRRLNAAMDTNSVALRNATAELKRLGVAYSGELGVDLPSLMAATAKWSPEERIRIKSGLANVGLLD